MPLLSPTWAIYMEFPGRRHAERARRYRAIVICNTRPGGADFSSCLVGVFAGTVVKCFKGCDRFCVAR